MNLNLNLYHAVRNDAAVSAFLFQEDTISNALIPHSAFILDHHGSLWDFNQIDKLEFVELTLDELSGADAPELSASLS